MSLATSTQPEHASARVQTLWWRALPWLFTAALAVGGGIRSLRAAMLSPDELMLLVFPLAVRDGQTPNADFYTVYGAPMYHALSAVYDVVGYTAMAERIVAVTYHVAIMLAVFALLRRYGTAPALVAVVVCHVMLAELGPTAFGWLGALALLLWGIHLALREDSRIAWLAGGALAALSSGFRYEFAIVAVLAAIPLVVRHSRARFLIFGGVVGAAPTAWHVVRHFDAFYGNVVTGRVNGNFQASPELVGNVAPALTWICAVLAVGLVVIGVTTRDRALMSLSLAGVAMLPQAFQRVDQFHLAFVGGLVFPLAVAVALRTHGDRLFAIPALRRTGVGLLVALLVLTTMSSAVRVLGSSPTATVEGRSLPSTAKANAAIEGIARALEGEVPHGSAIFLGTEDLSRPASPYFPLYYLLWDTYDFPQYYLDHAIGVAENDPEQVIADIRLADAAILLDIDQEDVELLFPNLPAGSTAPNDVLRSEFCAVAEHDPLTLYVRCER